MGLFLQPICQSISSNDALIVGIGDLCCFLIGNEMIECARSGRG